MFFFHDLVKSKFDFVLIFVVYRDKSCLLTMDATTSGTPGLQYHDLPDHQPVASPPVTTFQRQKRQRFGDSTPGEFPLAAIPSIVLHVLTECRLDPRDLANLEVLFFELKSKIFF